MNRRTSKFFPFLLSACVISGSVFLSSCGKDDDEVAPGTEFSELSIEENKAKLEDNAIALVNDVTALKNTAAVEATTSLTAFIDAAGFPIESNDSASARVMTVMTALARVKNGGSPSQVLHSFRANEEIAISEDFNANTGTYSYNDTTWTYNDNSSDAIIFEFPSTENGTENDAQLKIYGLATTPVNNAEAELTGELPTALKADLTVGSTKVIEYVWTAAYKSNGEPTSLSTSLTVAPFKFAVSFTNSTSAISTDYAFTKDGANLISFGASATGDFNSSTIGDDQGDVDDVVYTAASYVQFLNIKLDGDIDIAKLDPKMDAAETNEDVAAAAAALNEHTNLKLYYVDSGKKIADTEFYVYEDTDYQEEWVDIRLIFADGSKQDIETYTETGFSELTTQIENLFEELEGDLESDEEVEPGM